MTLYDRLKAAISLSAITVWRFEDAPADFRDMSQHGGDEDWLAYVPEGIEQPSWMYSGTPFGCFDVSEHKCIGGGTVYIGAHS
jgi:hypothetical protein